MKYLGKVSIGEDGNVIINPIDPDVVVGSGTKIAICDRDGELIAVIPEDGEFKGETSSDSPEILELPKDHGMTVPEGISKNGVSDRFEVKKEIS